jgi:biopolymer transport protein TolR
MPKLTTQQRAYIRRRTKVHEPDPSEVSTELNIVPFLDIVVNLIMFLLATSEAVLAITQIEAQLPSLGRGGGAPKEPGLNLSITVTDNGVIVTGSGGKLAPGCDQVTSGRALTVPKAGAAYDWKALTDCIVKVKERWADEEDVMIGADPVIQYEHVVAAMDAVRSNGKQTLFPKILLSAGVR